MTRFGGSFRFVQLPAVTQLLADLRSTGRLSVSHAAWSGEIVVREGQIVGARLGAESGRAALEAIALALPDAEFSFTDEPVDATREPLIAGADRAAYLDRLGTEHQRLATVIPSLGLVPCLVDASADNSADTQVTIGAAALQLIPSLLFGHTLEQVARERGLVRTLRAAADLLAGGLIRFDPKPGEATQAQVVAAHIVAEQVVDKPGVEKSVGEKPAAVLPFSPRPSTARSATSGAVRSVAVAADESTLPTLVRQLPPRQSFARHSTPSTVTAQPPAVIPLGVTARLSAARGFAPEPLAPAPIVTPGRDLFAGWRKALFSFFVRDGNC